jgi:hypothetical protein
MTSGSGNIRDSFSGSVTLTDYLGPLRRSCILCGPLCVSTVSADTITTNNLIVSGSVAQGDPPRVAGPNTHVWLPFGPISVTAPGPVDINIPIGLGSWQLELMAVGTGRDTGVIYAENFAHYDILASLRSSGTSVTLVQTNVAHVTEWGSMISPPPPLPFTVITFVDGGSELILRISPLSDSNWSGYVRLLGAPPFV